MAENSKIEWCDHTFNPWTGCTKVSPGCANCYAETLSKRAPKTFAQWGKGQPRKRTSEANWKLPLRWEDEAAAEGWQRSYPINYRPRVFCASLADWLDDEVPVEWLADLLDLIRRTPNLDWLLLTKRPENWRSRMMAAWLSLRESGEGTLSVWLSRWLGSKHRSIPITSSPPENVWIGTSVEDQTRADDRIPALLRIPARVRFLSCEPLLGPLEVGTWFYSMMNDLGQCAINWVIAGGESGHGARPMHPDWARSLRDQCDAAGVPFLFKQWGEWHETDLNPKPHAPRHLWPDGKLMHKCGKKFAGRLLDGREHNEFPKP